MQLCLKENRPNEMVGDGKLPNRYWVTATTDFRIIRVDDDYSYLDHAEDLMQEHNIESKVVKSAVFDKFCDAEQMARMLYIPKSPSDHHASSVIIEDRISGVVWERSTIATEGEWGYTFHIETWSDYTYTKEHIEKLRGEFV